MMEAFKLLTRSSNLAKPKSGKDASSEKTLPSTGQPHPPETSSAKGTKRKRQAFANEKPSPAIEQAERGSNEPGLDESAFTHISTPNSSFDAKAIMRKHKIKVTILQRSKERTSSKSTQLYPPPLTSFRHLRSQYSISRRLDENVQSLGYTEPTEVQMGSMPLLLAKRNEMSAHPEHNLSDVAPPTATDLLSVAPTGSGKTLAFLIPTIQRLIEKRQIDDTARGTAVHAIILAPSHELVEQIVNEGKKLAVGTGVRISALKRGMRISEGAVATKDSADESEDEDDGEVESSLPSLLKSDVVVGTPPMLLGAISGSANSSAHSLPSVSELVLDEADILLDKMFNDRTLSIWNACVNPSLRVSLWSATMSSTNESFVQNYILDRRKRLVPGRKSVPHCIVRLVVGLKDSSIPNIDHRLTYAASEQGKLVALRQLLHPASAGSDDVGLRPPFLVFTQTIPRAIALHSELLYDIPVEAGGASRIAVLHSELSDHARSNIMTGVRKGEIWVLITTDLLSRGIDFKGMNGVVSYDIPSSSATYVHRAGRTGRQGREGGIALTLYTKEDIPYVKNVANVIAASSRARDTKQSGSRKTTDEDLQRWLLDSLPDISKKTRQMLKQTGIAHRKSNAGSGDSKLAQNMRISTKSGYDRKLQNRKKATFSQRPRDSGQDNPSKDHDAISNDEWTGFD